MSDRYKYGKCLSFGEKNVVSGEVSYEYAELCRNNESKCGIKGKYFKDRIKQTNQPTNQKS